MKRDAQKMFLNLKVKQLRILYDFLLNDIKLKVFRDTHAKDLQMQTANKSKIIWIEMFSSN